MAKQISIKAILEDLAAGKTRPEIVAELGLNPKEAKELWKQPKLQNKKTAKYKVDMEIVDDTVEVVMPQTNFTAPTKEAGSGESPVTGTF